MQLRTRATRLALTAVLVLVWISADAQKTLPPVPITMDVKDQPLGYVLDQLSRQSHLSFSYNPKRIPLDRKVSITCEDLLLGDVLKKVLGDAGVTYSFVENQIVLQRARPAKGDSKSSITISGYVRDKKTGEALIGSTIYVPALSTGAVTNDFGFYSLSIPPGDYQIEYSFIGFKSEKKFIHLVNAQTEHIELEDVPPILEEVVISEPVFSSLDQRQTSQFDIRPQLVEKRPAMLGEPDVVKSLEMIPGVKIHSDGSTFYYVRGGARDQNLILIDDAPIFNPSHLLGFFSTVIPDAVNRMTFYKGDMPASLGGRISSVLDIETRKGNDKRFSAWGGVGLIATRLGIEGPFKENKSSYLLSGRFSRLAWIFKNDNNDIQEFGFWDLTGKVNFRLNERNRIYVSFYSGRDAYLNLNSGLEWSNRTATFRWNHLFNDRLFLNTTVSSGEYDYFLHQNRTTSTSWNSHIANFNIKTDFTYFVNTTNDWSFGLHLAGYNFNPGNVSTQTAFQAPVVSVRNTSEVILYGQNNLQLNDKLRVSYGARINNWNNLGGAFEYIYDQNRNPVDTLFYSQGKKYNQFNRIEPRLSANYLLTGHSMLKASVSRNVQNIHLINNSISPFTSLEVWLPSSFNIQPQAAWMGTIGYYRDFENFALEGEIFYKHMNHQIDYEPHAETLLNPYLESELRFGKTSARGVEALLKKHRGRWNGMVGYTYSRSFSRFADLNEGERYPSVADRPHQINVVSTFEINRKWSLGLNWIYASGTPYSAPTGFYYFNGQEVPVYGAKNNTRLPDYHRLDFSAELKLNKNPENKYQHSLSLAIYNAYGRKNILFVDYNKVVSGADSYEVPVNLADRDRITTQRYLLRFTPSITYNFKWR